VFCCGLWHFPAGGLAASRPRLPPTAYSRPHQSRCSSRPKPYHPRRAGTAVTITVALTGAELLKAGDSTPITGEAGGPVSHPGPRTARHAASPHGVHKPHGMRAQPR